MKKTYLLLTIFLIGITTPCIAEDIIWTYINNDSDMPFVIENYNLINELQDAPVEDNCSSQRDFPSSISAGEQSDRICAMTLQANTLFGWTSEGELQFSYTYDGQTGTFGAYYSDPPVGPLMQLGVDDATYPFNSSSFSWSSDSQNAYFTIPEDPS